MKPTTIAIAALLVVVGIIDAKEPPTLGSESDTKQQLRVGARTLQKTDGDLPWKPPIRDGGDLPGEANGIYDNKNDKVPGEGNDGEGQGVEKGVAGYGVQACTCSESDGCSENTVSFLLFLGECKCPSTISGFLYTFVTPCPAP